MEYRLCKTKEGELTKNPWEVNLPDDFKDNVAFHKELLRFAKFIKDKANEGRMYSSLGDVFRNRCEYKKAIENHELALGIARDLKDKVEEAYACGSLGDDFQKVCAFNKAIEYHNIALRISIDLKDKAGEAKACRGLGHAFRALYYHKQAIEYYERCLSVAKELGDKALEGDACSGLGYAFHEQSHYTIAEKYHNQHLNIAKSLKDKSGEQMAYTSLGSVFGRLGDFKKSLDHFKCAVNIAKELGDKEALMLAYGGLGKAFEHLGNLRKAEEYTNLRLNLSKEIGNKCEEGSAYCNLGDIFSRLGNFKKSIECFNRQLKIAKEIEDLMAEGAALGGLGVVFDSLGEFEKAIDYHTQHLRIAKTIKDKDGQGIAYGNLGNAYLSLEDFKNALYCFEQRLSIAKNLGDKAREGRAYGHLGSTYQQLGDYNKAGDYYNRRLCIAQELGDKAGEGAACGYIGSIFLNLGRYTIGIGWNERRLRIAEDLGDKDMEGKAYSDLGRCFEMLESLSKALKKYQKSVEVFNQMRGLLQSEDKWKIGFRNEYNHAYTGLCRVLLKQGNIDEALVAAEEGRAQSLADLMTSRYGFHEGQTEEKRLHDEEFATLNNAASSTIFLSLSENKLNIWLVLKEKPVLHRQKTLCHYFSKNAAAETLQSLIQFAYEKSDVRTNVNCENRSLDVLHENRYTVERSPKKCSQQILQEDNLPLAGLYSYVITPILDLIEGDELIIVPDGPLWLAPFAALLNPFSKYLSESFKVRLIPSLASLKIIANCPKFHSSSGALVVGDPDMSEVTNSQGDQILQQLPFARQEAQMIGKILNTAPLTGKLATKCEVLKQISSVAVVHIAAHGRMETGEIALSPNPERESQTPSEEDYMLTMADVMSVKLRAKLVVLSCCHSGRGEIKAEGVVGIARAFIGAGARSVLVSLWAIDDEATLEFMKSFYHNFVKGRSASESLNHAMKCLRESEKFGDLKYWAPFTLIGDDVTLDKHEEIRVS